MSRVIRLKSYKTFFDDGKSSATIDHADKSRVFVAVVLGSENLKIQDGDETLDIDGAILALADHIKQARKGQRRKASK